MCCHKVFLFVARQRASGLAWKKQNKQKNRTADLSWGLKHNILLYCNLSPPSGTTGCSRDCLPLTNEVKTSISTHISCYKGPQSWLQPPLALPRVAFSNVFLSPSVTGTTINYVTYETGLQALWPPLPFELAVKVKKKKKSPDDPMLQPLSRISRKQPFKFFRSLNGQNISQADTCAPTAPPL